MSSDQRRTQFTIFRLTVEQQHALHSVAARRGISVSDVVRDALDNYSQTGKLEGWSLTSTTVSSSGSLGASASSQQSRR
jgi:hypothetical protein